MVDPLDEILQRRAAPPASSNLEARIIEASRRARSHWLNFYKQWLVDVMDNIVLPSPAVAVALILVLGFYFGFALENAYVMDQDLSVFYVEDVLELKDWL